MNPESAASSSLNVSALGVRHLRCFAAIAHEGSLSRAAQRLHLSQPAVSKTLAELERLAGVSLVDRGRAGARLTGAGESFLPQAVEAVRAIEAAAVSLAPGGQRQRVTIRIGALPTAATAPLVNAITGLQRRHRDVSVQVRTMDNPELLASVKAGEVDVAIGRMAEPAMMQGLAFELLYAETIVVVVRPGHPLLAVPRPPSSALHDFPLVLPMPDTAPRQRIDAFFQSQGIRRRPGTIETQAGAVARAAVLASDALWITPRHAVQVELEHGWLRTLDLAVSGGSEPVGLVVPSGTPLSGLVSELAGLLRQTNLAQNCKQNRR